MSIAIVFIIILVLLIKFGKASIGPSVVAVLAGLYLAGSQIAEPVRNAVSSAVNSLNGII